MRNRRLAALEADNYIEGVGEENEDDEDYGETEVICDIGPSVTQITLADYSDKVG